MTDYLLGLLTAVVFFCCLLLFFWMGTRYAQKKPPDKGATEQEKRDMAKLHNDFLQVMNYNEEVARRRKQVK